MPENKKQKHKLIANGYIVNADKFLVVRRSEESGGAGTWEFPGGHIEFGEHPDNAVVREVKEETGLDLKPKYVYRIFSKEYEKEDKKVHKIRIVYYFETSEDKVKLDPREHDDYRWLSKDELEGFLIGKHVKRCVFGR
ncbi:MAG: NUDIX domain-containing protein [Candidatus Pacearchaeota archaeon]